MELKKYNVALNTFLTPIAFSTETLINKFHHLCYARIFKSFHLNVSLSRHVFFNNITITFFLVQTFIIFSVLTFFLLSQLLSILRNLSCFYLFHYSMKIHVQIQDLNDVKRRQVKSCGQSFDISLKTYMNLPNCL